MNSYIRDIIVIGIGIYIYAWWYISSKNKTIRKYAVIQGILVIIVVVTYNAMKLFDLPALGFLGLGSIVSAIVFLVKAILLERRLKKSSE